ncbi:psaC [Symbiodinium sp. CCMP2456]|nr:psaC [Symbiodinium sp. CCMP2456]
MDRVARDASSGRRGQSQAASSTPTDRAEHSTPDSAETVMGVGGGREWTPSVRGRPEVLSRESFRHWQEDERQDVWDDQWSSWSSWQSQGTSWEDPWSSYLDRRRPGWRRYRDDDQYENWGYVQEEDDEDEPPPTPPGSMVPFPRLLSRRENSPEPKEPPHRDFLMLFNYPIIPKNIVEQEQYNQIFTFVPAISRKNIMEQAQEPRGTGVVRPDLPQQVPGVTFASMTGVQDSQRQGSNGYGKEQKSGDTGGSGGYLRLHSSFPPEFRAKPGESWKDYWRSVEFWLASEGSNLPASVRGARLMQSMKERAGKIVAHLTVNDVAADNGVQRIKDEMEKSPIIRLLEHKEVDKTRKKFMRLCRHPRESLESFINRASIYRHENDRCQNYRVGTKFYLGHLLDAAKLTNKDEALVKTAAGGLHDENKVVNAMLELAEQLEGKPGYPIAKGEPNLHDDDEYLFQKGREKEREEPGPTRKPFHRGGRGHDGRFRKSHKLAKRWKQVFHAILEDEDDNEDEDSSVHNQTSSDEEDDRDEGPEAGNEREEESASDSSALPAEVYAQEYKAKKKVNEIRQMRQFFQKGTNPDKTKAWVREQQKKEPCFLCGRLGHWSQECPNRARSSGRPPHAVNAVAGNFTSDRGQWDLLETMAGYMSAASQSSSARTSGCFMVSGHVNAYQSSVVDHESFWAMRELHSSLILDIGCMKSVAGTKWTNQHIQRLRGLGRWMKAVKEKESFRFGDGHELCSEYAFIFEATIMGVRVLLRISVVSKYGLTQTYGGHYALPIAEYTADMPPMHDPNLPEYVEAIPVYVMTEDIPAKPSTAQGSRPEHHKIHDADSDTSNSAALKGGFSDWSRAKEDKERPRRPKPIIKGNFARRSAASRSKSAEKAKGAVMTERMRKGSPSRPRSPAARPSKNKASSSEAPGTPSSIRSSATIASLKAQAAELEERIWPHMDPTTIITEGSKATKAYWIARVEVLKEELGFCKGPAAMDEDADKPIGDGERDYETLSVPPRAPRGRPAVTNPMPKVASSAHAAKVERHKALTDHAAPFPTISTRFSDDLVVNAMISIQSQLFTFKWKTFVWMVRIREAVRLEMGDQAKWRRNARWLMSLFGKQLGALWGHLGAARQLTNDFKHIHLMRGNDPVRATKGQRILGLMTLMASWGVGYNVLELFPTGACWTEQAVGTGWQFPGPIWDNRAAPTWKQARWISKQVRQAAPDVLILAPPTGPWSTWSRSSSKETTAAKVEYWPMWHLIWELWKYQSDRGGLVLLQWGSHAAPPCGDELRELGRRFMMEHPVYKEAILNFPETPEPDPIYDGRVDMCMFGLLDHQTSKPYKKTYRLHVNDPWWCSQLSRQAQCSHLPGQHQGLEGVMVTEELRIPRHEFALRWPAAWVERLLTTVAETLQVRRGMPQEVTQLALHEPSSSQVEWEAVPVEVENSPEGMLRHKLGEVTGDKYDYIYFEGASAALSKQLRTTLARLHVSLGHVSAEKLKRMLHLSGAKDHILSAVSDLRCQICQSVTSPTRTPKAAYDRPQRFNERVVADVFFVWDANQTKYAAIHAVDAFSLYQVASLMPTAKSDLVAHFLKNYWLGIFGPPEVLMTDAGNEFAAHTEALLRAFDVHHEMVPPSAKWRMGLAERRGAVLKLLAMKTIKAVTAKGYSETKECLVAAAAARNRQMRVGGFSPVQIVLGRDVAIPSSLLAQLESGHFRYVVNQDLTFTEARRRNEQIRQAAEQAFLWADGSETLRKALSSRTRPGVVVALERRGGAIKRVWIRYRNKLKGVPLEYVRLAALEEVESTKVCQEALREVERELEGGRPDVEEMLDDHLEEPTDPLMAFSGDEETAEEEEAPPDPTREPPRGPGSVLDDLPLQFHRRPPQPPPREASPADDRIPIRDVVASPRPLPEEQPNRKKVRFDEAVKATEQHLSRMKAVLEPRNPQQGGDRGEASASSAPMAGSSTTRPHSTDAPSPGATMSHRGYGVLHACRAWNLEEATRSQRKMIREARRRGWEAHGITVDALTTEIMDYMEEMSEVPKNVSCEPNESPSSEVTKPVTGKPRLEYKWTQLSEDWKQAFIDPLRKAIDAYVDHDALEPVPLGSRAETLEEAVLKARWVLAGHRDKEAGMHATEAPTASLVSHNLICFVSAQKKWILKYADISAAFLQGEKLDVSRVVYVKLPKGYPSEINDHLLRRLSERTRGSLRHDLVKLVKGGFGLAESPRLWYLRLKRGLEDVGLKELKLSPGTFVFHVGGELQGILAIHVDDIRMAFAAAYEYVLNNLREKFHFGEWKTATEEVVKFCGRWEKQCPTTYTVTISMDGYAEKLKDPPQRPKDDRSPLTDAERSWVSSVGGQLNWMARQGRADLAFGISRVQQMSGARDPETLKVLGQLVTRARQPYECIFQRVPGELDGLVFLAVSDASHGSMPKGRSQGGMMILLANEEVLESETVVNCVLYHSSVLKRVVRSSLAAEISQAAETLEQCDYIRTVMAEILDPNFQLAQWRWSAGQWKQVLVLDSKTGYDILNSISHGEDKRLAIDIAILKESLYEPMANRWVRWVPGLTMPSDGLTKEAGNPMRDIIMRGGPWSLKDNPAAQRLREEAGHRKRQCRERQKVREQDFEQKRQAQSANVALL